MKQTKIESMAEIFFNYLSGFLIAYLVYEFVIIPNPYLQTSLLVTTIYTAVGIVRSYFWRRFFNAGINKLVRKLIV